MLTRILIVCAILLISNNSLAQENVYNFLIGKQTVDYNKLFKEVMDKVKKDYVDEVTDAKLIEAALEGMLSALDPHSGFLNEKEFQEMKITTKGEFGGIGIEVTMDKGFLKVISPYEDGPAFKSGIKVGDYITIIDDQVVKGLSLSQAVEKLRGKPKTKVKLGVYRESSGESLEFSLMRDIIRIVPVKAKIVASDVALLRVSNFSENTATLLKKEFFRLVDQAKESNTELKGIILDLRWNPGGLLDQAKEVTELFLEDGVIVTTKGRLPDANKVFKANGFDVTEGLPLVILINGGSASASEIVAGALQDNKRGLLVGTKTFGKGSVQTVQPLIGNMAMKLTTSRYYTPSGRSIQANGIEPDVMVEEAVVTPVKGGDYGANEASLVGHLGSEDGEELKNNKTQSQQNKKTSQSGKQPSIRQLQDNLSGKEMEDFQLLRAVDMVKGMALYSERFSN